AYGANNHGSIVEIQGQPYIFYNRHTNGTWYSRQGCAEKLTIRKDGSIEQAPMTSCGLNGGPLPGLGYYPAYLACNLFTDSPAVYVGGADQPRVMQDGRDGDENEGYIGNMQDGATAGFKFFRGTEARQIRVWTRGYAQGVLEVRTQIGGEVLAELPVEYANVWEESEADITLPEGEYALYLTFRGQGNTMLKGFELR
ncbi:MAG: alpha-N-arabinofuranosidase, partial [Acetatifactor sp.]|nr:alpha-N-arabinofuranosidase [Acetatifactor sp.]